MRTKLLLLILYPVLCFSAQEEFSAPQILTQLQKNFSDIEDYTVQVHAEIEMKDINVPPMDVTVYFKKPAKIHVQSRGFAILPREGLVMLPNRFKPENFYTTLLGKDTVETVETYKLELIPRSEKVMVRKFILWVDVQRWVIIKMHSITWQGQSSDITFNYTLIQQKYWLPQKVIALVDLSGFRGFDTALRPPGHRRTKITTGENRKGKLTLIFSNYKLNSGLSDSIFEQEK